MHALLHLWNGLSKRQPQHRVSAAFGVGAAVLLVHAWVLWPATQPLRPGTPAATPWVLMEVRSVASDASKAPATASETDGAAAKRDRPTAAGATGAAQPAALAAPPDERFARPGAISAVNSGTPTSGTSVAPGAPADPIVTSANAADEDDAGTMTASELASLPTGGLPRYSVRLPGAAQLNYRLTRSAGAGFPAREGRAQLLWKPETTGAGDSASGGYRLELLRQWDGATPTGWISRGGLSAGASGSEGLAPERFADSRRQREVAAANFERETGRIRFSGPRIEYPLWPGVQDRASWMLQLAGVLQANPDKRDRGAEVAMVVVGARGDASLWRFVQQGAEPVLTTSGVERPALRLKREPRHSYDTQVEVWLDPQRQYLPLRVRWLALPSGVVTEMTLD